MAKAYGKCKICNYRVSVGDNETPPDIAAEGVMESIQDHIFQHHCNADYELNEGSYDSVSDAWEYA